MTDESTPTYTAMISISGCVTPEIADAIAGAIVSKIRVGLPTGMVVDVNVIEVK
jgi:hypothetical protein